MDKVTQERRFKVGAFRDARQQWVQPTVEKIEAGSAEIGSDVIADAGVTKS